MTRRPAVPHRRLDGHVARLLAAVFGPLGEWEGMRAYDAALDCTAELARSCPSDREHNTIAESAYRQVFLADGVPDYLRGLSRAELHARIADYCDAHYRGYVEEREERDRRALELLEVDGWLLTDAEDYGADYPTPEVLL